MYILFFLTKVELKFILKEEYLYIEIFFNGAKSIISYKTKEVYVYVILQYTDCDVNGRCFMSSDRVRDWGKKQHVVVVLFMRRYTS